MPLNWVPSVTLSEQTQKDWQGSLSTLKTAPFVHLMDQDSFELGAPQHISSLRTLLAMKPCEVQMEASVPGVHVAEMLISLGVDRLVLDKELHKTERSGTLFFSRLRHKLVAVVTDQHSLHMIDRLINSGCQEVLYRGLRADKVAEWGRLFQKVQWDLRRCDEGQIRNLVQQTNVPIQIQGLIVSYDEYQLLVF